MVSSSSDDLGPALAGIRAVVEALPHAALVTDADGRIHCANAEAARLLGDGLLTDAALTPEVQVLRRLRRMSRSTAPSYLRLEFADAAPVIFRGVMLSGNDMRKHCLILLVADKASTLIGKFLNLKSLSKDTRRELHENRQRQQLLRQEAEHLKQLSETDPLTGLLNVRAFETKIRHVLGGSTGRAGLLVFIDLDEFKLVNDLYGHEAGDQALRHVAKTLRRAPSRAGVIAARVGGDEFAYWRSGAQEAASDILAGLRVRISSPVTLVGKDGIETQVQIRASMGVALCPQDADTYDALLRVADRRMYADKAR